MLLLDDIDVEIRDRHLNLLGQIPRGEINLTATPVFNNVGTWQLALPHEHEMAAALRTPGSGVVVYCGGDVFASGVTETMTSTRSAEDPIGTLTFQGVTDDVILSDMLAFPEPGNPDPTTQALGHDVRTGPAETLLHDFVRYNVGTSAPAARRTGSLGSRLQNGVNGARGAVTTKSARFDTLGELLAGIALPYDLGFRVVQRGNALKFETYKIVDRTPTIRLDVWNNTVSTQEVALSAPAATRVVVAGSGEDVNRAFYFASATGVASLEEDWGRRIERFVDQRQTDDVTEYAQAAAEVLAEDGFAKASAAMKLMDDSTMRFGYDWGLGDRVTIVDYDGEYSAPVTSAVLQVNSDGVALGAILGDPTLLRVTNASPITKIIQQLGAGVSSLQRSQ